ncbi:phasin family protein [Vogesella oryzae]|uniref:phasin family protein n=1 Tax=Vogesella oryzae TaxID=1735285 RepID=UPI001583D4A0|nr:phasin family protein [Vogesella oryzae]
MITSNEQLNKLSFGALDMAFRMAQISLDSTEKFAKLSLELSKQSLEDNVKLARELGDVKEPQQAVSSLNQLAARNLEQAVANSRNVYDIVSQTQAELGKLAEENFNELNKSVIGNLEALTKNAPAGSETLVNTLKSGLAASTAALHTLTKAGQQVVEFADSSVKAATSATADAVKSAAKRTAG